MVEKQKRMSDIQPEMLEVEEKISIDAILDKDMMFIEFAEASGQYGEFIFVVITDPDDKRRLGFSTGATVVCRKLIKARDEGHLPILAKIVKKDRYYDII